MKENLNGETIEHREGGDEIAGKKDKEENPVLTRRERWLLDGGERRV